MGCVKAAIKKGDAVEDLKERREERGWSRAELARRAGMHPSTVGQIEAGKLDPYPGQERKLEAALRRRPRKSSKAVRRGRKA